MIAPAQTCARCSALHPVSASGRIRRGWKRAEGDTVVCPACWTAGYSMRAISLPVAGPLGEAKWTDLRAALGQAWQDSTRLANWLMTEHAKADRVRMPADAKLWKAPNPYLYPMARQMCPGMSTAGTVAVINQVSRKYNSCRLDVVWRGASSLPSFRYPVPYPIPAANWKARWMSATERVPVVSVPISGVRFDLRLRGGAEFRRQLGAFAALVDGSARPVEMALYRSGGNAAHRPGMAVTSKPRIMAKLVAWIPRTLRESDGDKAMVVRRGEDCLLVADIDGRTPWRLNADDEKTRILWHATRLLRYGEDTKYEKRWPKARRRQINQDRGAVCIKQNHRLDTYTHEVSLMLAGLAARHGCAKIVLDETPTAFLPSFPWHDLKSKLEYKARERGVAVETVATARDDASD